MFPVSVALPTDQTCPTCGCHPPFSPKDFLVREDAVSKGCKRQSREIVVTGVCPEL